MILTKETLSAGPSIGTGEGVAHSKRWYVALVRMHHEKKVAERLDKIGIENFFHILGRYPPGTVTDSDDYRLFVILRQFDFNRFGIDVLSLVRVSGIGYNID